MDARKEKNEKAIAKLDDLKRRLFEQKPVYYNDRQYAFNAIRICYSEMYRGVVYQALLIDKSRPHLNWAMWVPLEAVMTEEEYNNQ